jgi:hypothetical protein
MATQLFTNNATGYLNASIASGDTSIVLQSGQGVLFPSPSGGNWFLVTLFDGTSTIEICKCTARTTDTLTVVRAQEGTTAAAFAAGARCELRATKGTFEALIQRTEGPAPVSGIANTATDWFDLPVGTNAQRGSPSSGSIRYNTDTPGFEGYNGSAWGSLGGGNTTTKGMWENAITISADYTIASGNNAVSAGPITVASGITVTVPSGSVWTIV